MENLIRSQMKSVTKEYQGEGVIEVIVNSGKLDRQGEILDINGLDLSNYLESPVVAWGHKYDEPAIGKALKVWKDSSTGSLKAIVKFAIEHSDMAKLVYNLIKDGYMNAFSIGFIPFEADEDANGNVVYTKSEMLEFSAVLVGADPRALATAKSIGGDNAVKALTGEMNTKDFHILSTSKSEAEKAVGDECKMPNGDEGHIQLVDGKLVCVIDEDEANEESAKKSVDSVEKVGRVLNKKNRAAVTAAIKALQDVLDADAPTVQEEKEIDPAVQIAEKALDVVKNLKESGGRTDYKKVRKVATVLYRATNEIIMDAKAKEYGTITIKKRK